LAIAVWGSSICTPFQHALIFKLLTMILLFHKQLTAISKLVLTSVVFKWPISKQIFYITLSLLGLPLKGL
jgi:hypothetical protein